MKCSYCKSDMHIVIKNIKRRVPPGANDLNIYDDVTCWQCTKCGLTTTEGIMTCHCGMLTINSKEKNSSHVHKRVLVTEDLDSDEEKYECSNCVDCNICKGKLGKLPYKLNYRFSLTGIHYDKNLLVNIYAHESCLKKCKSLGLCIGCGKKLSLLDKINKYKKCKRCRPV